VQAADWILLLEASPLDGALRAAFEAWLAESEGHRAEYDKVRHTWSRLGKMPAEAPTDVMRSAPRHARPRWIVTGLAAVAACLALVLFPVVQRHVLADYVTGVAELREIVLPDGSIASLDAGSAIAVDYRPGYREIVLLEGRVFFDVVPDRSRRFVVRAEEASVVVTGTTFDVRKAPESIAVAVQSGSVEVSLAGTREANPLSAGQELVYDRQAHIASVRDVAPAQVASWRSRRMVVYDVTFGDVIEELGRHMTGAIVVRDKSLNRQLVSGVFDLSQPREALEGLAGSQRATLTRITPYLMIVSAP
jgi:transmembrane sensor